MIVMPDQDAVVAITAEVSDMQGELDLVWQHLLPAMKPQPLPRDPQSQAALRQTLSSLALTPPKGQRYSYLADRISGQTFTLNPSDLGFHAAAFTFRNDGCVFALRDRETEYPIACGLERWQRGETALPGTPPRLTSGGAPPRGTKSKLAASGTWKDPNTFEMMLRYYETPHHDTITCRFDTPQVRIGFMNSMAQMSPTPKDKRPTLQGRMVG
jgi:hypothetical protein